MRARIGFGLALAALLGGCNPAIGKCEDQIKAALRSPATFKRVDYSVRQGPDAADVSVTYDAENAFGAPIRATHSCRIAGFY